MMATPLVDPEHVLSRSTGGKDYESWIQPVCSCGWAGLKSYAYSDYQLFNVATQENKHLHEACLARGLRKTNG